MGERRFFRMVNRVVSMTSAWKGETGLVAGTRLVVAVSGLWFVLLVTRNLGPVGRGEITIAFSLAWGAVIVGDLGVVTACRLRLLAGVGAADRGVHALAAGSMLGVQGALAGLGAVLFGLTGTDLGASVVVATVGLAVSIGAMRAASELGYGVRGYRWVSFVELGVAAGQVVASTGLWTVGRLSTTTAVIAMAIPHLVGAVVMGRRLGFVPSRIGTRVPFRSLATDGLSSMLGSAAHYLAVRSNRLVVAGVLGARSAGEFAVAVTLPETLRLVPRAISQVLGDRLRSGETTLRDVRRPLILVILCYVVLQGVVAWVGPGLVTALFGETFTEVVEILPVLALAECLFAVSLVFGGLLKGLAHPSRIGVPDVVGAVVTVVVTTVVVGRWGISGAAWAAVAGAASMALVGGLWARVSLRHATAGEWGR